MGYQRAVINIVTLVSLMLDTGCARWFLLKEIPSNPQPLFSASLTNEERLPGILSSIHITRNGAVMNSDLGLERRLLELLDQTGIFSQLTLLGYGQFPSGRYVRAQLFVEEVVDPHPGDAAWKGFMIGASMFLLSPFVSLEYDYASDMTLEIERWDGQTKKYTGFSKGTAYYNLFGATPLAAIELKGRVTERCFTSLMAQLVKDSDFVAGRGFNSLAPSANAIRTGL